MQRCFIVTVLLLCIPCHPSVAQSTAPPKRILFIGNSLTYSNNLPVLVHDLALAARQPEPFVDAITQGGASLGDHWQNPNTRLKILSSKWDYIVLQQGPTSLAASQAELQRDLAVAKPWFKQTGAKPALFMVWPETTRRRFFPNVRDGYANAAKAVDGMFLPAGLALKYLQDKQPNVALFTDNLHPTPVGTYLAAMVITAKLTGASPDQFPATIRWANEYAVRLSPAEHQLCIDAVKEALKDEGNK